MEYEFQPDEWFPRHKRGTCFAAGPSAGSDLADKLIAKSLQGRREVLLRKREDEWKKVLDTFQEFASALAKFMPVEKAERKANRAFNRLCIGKFVFDTGAIRVRRSGIYIVRKPHLPDYKCRDFVEVVGFIDAANNRSDKFHVCCNCIALIRKDNQAEHESRCKAKPNLGSLTSP